MANPYALDFNPLASAITDNQQLDMARNRLAMDQKRLGFEAERLGFERDQHPLRLQGMKYSNEGARLGNESAQQGIDFNRAANPYRLTSLLLGNEGARLGNESTKQSIQAKDMEIEKDLYGRISALGQMMESEPDPVKRDAMLKRIYETDTRIRDGIAKKLPPEVVNDPLVFARYARAVAAGYQSPQTMKVGEGDAVIAVSRDPANPSAPPKMGEVYRNPKGKEPPTGYELDPTKPGTGALRPIAGGPADKITGEQAARTALIVGGVQNMPKIRSIFLGTPESGNTPAQPGALGGNMNPLSYMRHYTGVGDVGEGQRLMASGMEGVLRALTGAAATKEEVAREVQKYLPQPSDSMETRERKLNLFETNLRLIANLSAHGTSGSDILKAMQTGTLDTMKVQGQVPSRSAPIPPDAVRALQSDPNLAAQFDAKYGAGASKQYLIQR